MILKKIFPILFGLILVGCSQENQPELAEDELVPVNFVAIGEDQNNVYQYSFDATAEQGTLTNLTAELSVPTDYLTLREVGNLVSFYTFSGGAFTLRLKDVVTGETATYSDFFANSPERGVVWGINNESNVFFGFFGPADERNLGIQDVEFEGEVGVDTFIDFDIDFIFQPLLFENRVYFVYRDEFQNYKLTFYDIASKSSGPQLNFGTTSVSFLMSELGELVVIKNGADARLELYDALSLSFIEEMPLQFGTGFNPGPIDGAVFEDNKLFYAFPYVQPALYPSGPAVFDLETQENRLIDFFGIASEIEAELGKSIGVTTQIYDAKNSVFLVGYAVLGDTVDGGLLQISKEGKLISNIPLPFFPNYIVRN